MFSPFVQVAGQDATALSTGLLIARLVFGLVLAAHGAQKLFGWFGGYGLAGTGGFFEQLGFRPGKLFAGLAGASEMSAGLLIATGFLAPVAAVLTIAVMTVAVITVHWGKGFFASGNGWELPLLYAVAAVVLVLTGPGRYSLDAALGLPGLWSPWIAAGAVVAGVAGGAVNLSLRRPEPMAQGAARTS